MNSASSPGAQSALLLLDLQDAICREDGEIGKMGFGQQATEHGVLDRAAWCLAKAREQKMFVAYSRLAFDREYSTLTSTSPRLNELVDAGLFQSDSQGAQICSEIEPEAGELVVDKAAIDPFAGTPLMAALLSRGITDVVMTGVATEHVVESAARNATDAGLHVTVLSDVCSSMTAELRENSLRDTLPYYSTLKTSDEVFS
jgi:nicotinamidase-related amidase